MDDNNVLRKMVLIFFAGVDDALTQLENGKSQEAMDLLQRVLYLTEEMLLAADDEDTGETAGKPVKGTVDELSEYRKKNKDEKS